MRPFKRFVAATSLLAVLAACPAARACPNCKEALASQTGEGAKLKDGYFYSILFMMAMPFALVGTGTYCVVRAVKKGVLPEL